MATMYVLAAAATTSTRVKTFWRTTKWFAKANNPSYSSYNSEKSNSWIKYDDANNLYCWSMIQSLLAVKF